jgi:hypothetical protein
LQSETKHLSQFFFAWQSWLRWLQLLRDRLLKVSHQLVLISALAEISERLDVLRVP